VSTASDEREADTAAEEVADEMAGHPQIPEEGPSMTRAAQLAAAAMYREESNRILGLESTEEMHEMHSVPGLQTSFGVLPPDPMPTALAEFKIAAREAHRTQLAAQEAAKRYAAAVKRMSELAVAESER
jgi:hypothetical protein